MDLRCPRCKARIEPGDTFCGECGCPLKDFEDRGMQCYDDFPEERGRKGKHTALIIVSCGFDRSGAGCFRRRVSFNYLEDRKGQEVVEELQEELEDSEEETDGKAETEEDDTDEAGEETEEPAEDPATDVTDRDYIFPDSDSRYLTDADLEGYSSSELELAKNEIYARHGRQFVTDYIADYFNSKSWYQGTIDPEI